MSLIKKWKLITVNFSTKETTFLFNLWEIVITFVIYITILGYLTHASFLLIYWFFY